MKYLILFLSLTLFLINIQAQEMIDDYPLLGAQVIIEPGQTDSDTEKWFKTMKDNNMSICRIRMFESYMRDAEGNWDFSLFDRAFRIAEKYDIKVMGTFFPLTDKLDIGGWKFPNDDAQLESFAEYIKQLTTHFKKYKSLYSWVLINEPGGVLKDNPFSRKMFEQWSLSRQLPDFTPSGYPILANLESHRFKRYMTSWMLNWIANEVRKHDSSIPVHVNNHAIYDNIAEYNFPYWRTFLTTLGGSAHASWHFTLFERKEYALAMSANSEILRSGAGDIPWLMTELQGGNNTYSGNNAMCPTSEEIAQWLWMILGSEGKGAIFWALNPRASGIEAGEWALLDFQNQPTDRMTMVANVSSCINKNNSLFANAKSMDSKISLVYLKESLWTEEVLIKGTPAETDGRKIGLKNLIGYFRALSEMGLTPQIKAAEEFDFSRSEYKGETIILPHQLAIPEQYKEKLELFVSKGGKLIVDGLTGFFDENVHNVMLTGFPFKDLFGGNISEFRKLETPVYYDLEGVKDIPVIGWQGFIIPNSQTKTVLEKDNKTLATRSKYGHGDAVWVPGLLGLAAWEVNASPLANWLYKELDMKELPFLFKNYEKDVLMKTLKSGDKFITIMVNKSGEERKLEIKQKGNRRLTPSVLFPENKRISNDYLFQIPSEETLVLCWE